VRGGVGGRTRQWSATDIGRDATRPRRTLSTQPATVSSTVWKMVSRPRWALIPATPMSVAASLARELGPPFLFARPHLPWIQQKNDQLGML
jgi:hypothetical protein